MIVAYFQEAHDFLTDYTCQYPWLQSFSRGKTTLEGYKALEDSEALSQP